MGSIQRDLDERDIRYLKLMLGRAQGADDEEIVENLDDPNIDSPHVLYRRLKEDGFPICPMCGTTYVEEGHCKPSRKARRGAGERQDLPSAAEAIPLFNSVVKALDSYLVDLTTLKEVYRDERFEAVDHYEVSALDDPEHNTTTYGPATIPLGAKLDPPHPLVALIAAYVIEDRPLDPLLEKLHSPTANLDRQQLDKKVETFKLVAHHVATLVRGGIVRRGQRTEELTAREQGAVEYITSRLRSGIPEPEIEQNLQRRGFTRSDIRRLKKFRLDYPGR
jgi:hypothetical protein